MTKDHYLNNREFYLEIVAYKEALKTNPKMKIPDSIGHAIIKIANKLASRYNFNSYTYKDEFISDGILKAIASLKSYNISYSNPMAYFTTIIWQSFVTRIQKEKAEQKLKDNLIQVTRLFDLCEHESYNDYNNDEIIGDFSFNSDFGHG